MFDMKEVKEKSGEEEFKVPPKEGSFKVLPDNLPDLEHKPTLEEPKYPQVKPNDEELLDRINDTKKKGGKIFYSCQPRRPGFGLGVPVAQAAFAHVFPTTNDNLVLQREASGSILTFCFNRLLADFLTVRKKYQVDYLAWVHDDIGAPMCWADIYREEMQKYKIDMLAAVVPLKDHRGLTSTAMETDNPWAPRRLTMKEVFDLPETFTDPKILLNSGLWLARADADWLGSFCWQQQDQMIKMVEVDGSERYIARTISEDWDWSRKIKYRGGSLYATRKVPLYHEHPQFTNMKVWGEWETDKGDSGKEEFMKKETAIAAPKQ
jgi:hypothetical protein